MPVYILQIIIEKTTLIWWPETIDSARADMSFVPLWPTCDWRCRDGLDKMKLSFGQNERIYKKMIGKKYILKYTKFCIIIRADEWEESWRDKLERGDSFLEQMRRGKIALKRKESYAERKSAAKIGACDLAGCADPRRLGAGRTHTYGYRAIAVTQIWPVWCRCRMVCVMKV